MRFGVSSPAIEDDEVLLFSNTGDILGFNFRRRKFVSVILE